jgi:hypothetical protein
VAHVEISVSEPFAHLDPSTNLDRWASVVAMALEPCLVVDADARIVAVSASCGDLFGLDDPRGAVGQFLLSGVLQLVDFTAARGELTLGEIDKIPPLLALSSGHLARGLIRVQCRRDPNATYTIDAIATPILEGETPVGSLTFFSPV